MGHQPKLVTKTKTDHYPLESIAKKLRNNVRKLLEIPKFQVYIKNHFVKSS